MHANEDVIIVIYVDNLFLFGVERKKSNNIKGVLAHYALLGTVSSVAVVFAPLKSFHLCFL